MQLKNHNFIQLIVSLIGLAMSIVLNFYIASQFTQDVLSHTLISVLATIAISIFAIGAIRSVTKTYRVACVILPFAAMLVPIFFELRGMLATMDPTDAAAQDNLTIFVAVSKQMFTVVFITAVILSLAILVWELKKAGKLNFTAPKISAQPTTK